MASQGLEFDEAMVALLMAQDEKSFKRLVKHYHLQLKKLASSIVGDSIAEEVVQDAWISIFNHLPTFEKRSSLKTWIYRITSNKAISRLRRESKVIAFSELKAREDNGAELDLHFDDTGHWINPPSQWHADDPQELLTGKELQECIEHVLSGLPQLQHAVFMLNDMEDQSTDEICNILEISASNMRVLLHRVRMKLFEHIDHFQETGEC